MWPDIGNFKFLHAISLDLYHKALQAINFRTWVPNFGNLALDPKTSKFFGSFLAHPLPKNV